MKTYVITVPSVGTEYYFFDDDKIKSGKRYLATVKKIINFEDASEELIGLWKENKKYSNWVYADMTDCFIECSIPVYDENPIYFVRDKKGAFYSIETSGEWQTGRLDITGEYNEALSNGYEKTKWNISVPDYLYYEID